MYAILLNHLQNRKDKFSTAIPICPYHQRAGIFFTKTLNNTIKTDPVTQSLLSALCYHTLFMLLHIQLPGMLLPNPSDYKSLHRILLQMEALTPLGTCQHLLKCCMSTSLLSQQDYLTPLVGSLTHQCRKKGVPVLNSLSPTKVGNSIAVRL